MADRAHELTDKEITRIQRHLAGIYRTARKDVEKELRGYSKKIQDKSDSLQIAIANAKDDASRKAAENAYKRFYSVDVKRDRQFRNAARNAAERLYTANTKAARYINSKSARIYAENYNEIGLGLQRDLDGYEFQPVSERDAREYGRITRQTIDKDRDISWNMRSIISSIITGALLWYGVDKIFAEAARMAIERNRSSGNRHASDTMTDAENKGRFDSMYRASDEGFSIKKYWSATLDNRTRDTHIEYDGMDPVELDYEYAPGLKKPRDPDCPDLAEVCNCRCRILYTTGHPRSETRTAREGEVTGSYKKPSSFAGTETVSIPNMSYKEWMQWRSKSQ